MYTTQMKLIQTSNLAEVAAIVDKNLRSRALHTKSLIMKLWASGVLAPESERSSTWQADSFCFSDIDSYFHKPSRNLCPDPS